MPCSGGTEPGSRSCHRRLTCHNSHSLKVRDAALEMGICALNDLQNFVDIMPVPPARPGQKRLGCRRLGVVMMVDKQRSSRRKNARRKKSVRFDERSNQHHEADNSTEESGEDNWYSAKDYDLFALRLKYRVEKVCESQQGIKVLERAHLGCMKCSTDEESLKKQMEEDLLPGGVKRAELTQIYSEIENLVGLEPYIAEYIPHWHDRHSLRQTVLDEVLSAAVKQRRSEKLRLGSFRRNTSPRCSMDQECRRVSLGSRVFAQEIAQASFRSQMSQ